MVAHLLCQVSNSQLYCRSANLHLKQNNGASPPKCSVFQVNRYCFIVVADVTAFTQWTHVNLRVPVFKTLVLCNFSLIERVSKTALKLVKLVIILNNPPEYEKCKELRNAKNSCTKILHYEGKTPGNEFGADKKND